MHRISTTRHGIFIGAALSALSVLYTPGVAGAHENPFPPSPDVETIYGGTAVTVTTRGADEDARHAVGDALAAAGFVDRRDLGDGRFEVRVGSLPFGEAEARLLAVGGVVAVEPADAGGVDIMVVALAATGAAVVGGSVAALLLARRGRPSGATAGGEAAESDSAD